MDTVTDPDNVVTRYTHDALNRRTSTTQDEGGLNIDTTYRYDVAGNLRFLTDAESQTTEMVYDALNQLTDVWYGADATDPAGITSYDSLQAYTLDPLGNRLDVQDNGSGTTYLPNNGQNLTNSMHRDTHRLELKPVIEI